MYATVAILAALAYRTQSGQGQYIDMALLDTQVAMIANMNMNYLVSGTIPKRQGNAHANIVPYQVFDASDGQFVIAVGNDSQFAKLCEAAGATLHKDERFKKNADRVRYRDDLIPLLAQVFRQRRVAEWIGALERVGVPVGGINNLEQVFEHPQVQARKMKIDVPHPLSGSVPLVASPIKMSVTPPQCTQAPPILGEHTSAILRDRLGMTMEQVEELRANGIVGVYHP
jgi:crotonobetainyl-CoA:carnitine CoA-transferase CaiB-like acyl-CoA transferase